MGVKDLCPQTKTVIFRFYGDLNLMLQPERRGRATALSFKGRQTVKHLVESLGVPHTEIGLIVSEDKMVDLSHIPSAGERLAVYPHFTQLELRPREPLRRNPNDELRFALDGHLGRLAAYLRMLGFDTLYQNHAEDGALVERALRERRILLTRDRGMLKRKDVTMGCCLLTLDPRQQLLQVTRRFKLINLIKPFTRCMACNGCLEDVPKQEIQSHLEPKTRRYFHVFKRCAECGWIFWAGSHHERMLGLIRWLKEMQEEDLLRD